MKVQPHPKSFYYSPFSILHLSWDGWDALGTAHTQQISSVYAAWDGGTAIYPPGWRKEISSPSLDRPLRTVWTIVTNGIQPNLIEVNRTQKIYFSESKSGKL